MGKLHVFYIQFYMCAQNKSLISNTGVYIFRSQNAAAWESQVSGV